MKKLISFFKNLFYPTSYQKDNLKISIKDHGRAIKHVVYFSVKQNEKGDHEYGYCQSIGSGYSMKGARRHFNKAKRLIKSGVCDGMNTYEDTSKFHHIVNSK